MTYNLKTHVGSRRVLSRARPCPKLGAWVIETRVCACVRCEPALCDTATSERKSYLRMGNRRSVQVSDLQLTVGLKIVRPAVTAPTAEHILLENHGMESGDRGQVVLNSMY